MIQIVCPTALLFSFRTSYGIFTKSVQLFLCVMCDTPYFRTQNFICSVYSIWDGKDGKALNRKQGTEEKREREREEKQSHQFQFHC